MFRTVLKHDNLRRNCLKLYSSSANVDRIFSASNCKNTQVCSTNIASKRNIYQTSMMCHVTCHAFSSFSGAPTKEPESELTASQYEDISEETLDSLTAAFEELGETEVAGDDFDVQYASGVLTVQLGEGRGTYVINKQTPNKQLWLSSPTSGPKRYDFKDGTWVYKYENDTLHQLLTKEISSVMSMKDLEFVSCEYGSKS